MYGTEESPPDRRVQIKPLHGYGGGYYFPPPGYHTLKIDRNKKNDDKLYRVLLIESDFDFSRSFIGTYKNQLLITSCSTGKKAVEFLKNDNFDIVIICSDLPDDGGIEILKMIKKLFPFVPVIFCTSKGSEKIAREAFLSGASDYFTKDLSQFTENDNLINSIRRSIKDISTRTQMEKDLRNSEERFRILFEYAPDAYYMNDMTGVFTEGNKAAQKLIGYEKEELIGKNFMSANLLPANHLPRAVAVLAKNILGMASGPNEMVLVRKDGKRIETEISTYPIRIQGKLQVLGVIRDVTHRNQTEEDLKNKNRELEEFTYMVSHDLKTPLNLIKSYLQLIQEDPGKAAEYIDRPINQTEHLITFINTILQLSRAGRAIGDKCSIQMDYLINNAFREVKQENVPVELTIQPAPPIVMGNPISLEQVFKNLLDNAFYYSDIKKTSLKIDVTHDVVDNDLLIKVRDNGVGIKRELLQKIFNAGFTLKKDKGTGFGLAIAKKIVEAHGGGIWVESPGLNKGAEFFVRLPLKMDSVDKNEN